MGASHFTELGKIGAYSYEDYCRPDNVERQKVLEGGRLRVRRSDGRYWRRRR
jgi:hypothetical protein